ncbi:hypothetical protein [Arthrobacter sp. EpRS71]|uniref:hypothetical protein n=1 Tax=Arthrobacter sp. EpRS71 TaxID=1743141 RepID=UPI0007479189|nr:hypothetical protein AR689_17540 [Arthrobacter sp. EpRS71]
MEGIGKILARRAGSPGASEVSRNASAVPLNVPSRVSPRKCPTPLGTNAETSWTAGLLLGLESLPKPGQSGQLGPEGVPAALLESEESESRVVPAALLQPLAEPEKAAAHGVPASFPALPESALEWLPTESALSGVPALDAALLEVAAATDALRSIAADEVRLLGFVEAADFAGRVEEMSRSVEYLQVVAAQAVERTRTEKQSASTNLAHY